MPLYTVGGARRPLLPVLKYCSLTDMALTMGPEMREGGVPSNPPMQGHTGQPRGTPVPDDRGWGSCGQGAWLCASGLAQGGRGQGDGSVGDEGRRAEAYWGPLGEQKGQGRGHEEPPRGAGRAWVPLACREVTSVHLVPVRPVRPGLLPFGVVGGPCLDGTGRAFGLVGGEGKRGWEGVWGPPLRGQGN